MGAEPAFEEVAAGGDAGQQLAARCREHGLGSDFRGHDDLAFCLRLIDDFADDGSIAGILALMQRINDALPPFDDPPYDESGEPAFLAEWLQAGR